MMSCLPVLEDPTSKGLLLSACLAVIFISTMKLRHRLVHDVGHRRAGHPVAELHAGTTSKATGFKARNDDRIDPIRQTRTQRA